MVLNNSIGSKQSERKCICGYEFINNPLWKGHRGSCTQFLKWMETVAEDPSISKALSNGISLYTLAEENGLTGRSLGKMMAAKNNWPSNVPKPDWLVDHLRKRGNLGYREHHHHRRSSEKIPKVKTTPSVPTTIVPVPEEVKPRQKFSAMDVVDAINQITSENLALKMEIKSWQEKYTKLVTDHQNLLSKLNEQRF